ncbi:MAG: GGDEF domain-containing protein [Gammaproteobacteria bacterium HGW-Gammaproteobacteria-11]|nr:MAG: GGDEF domain-containing protein [Gammaproteobacteria bacterium HGW-Gammaproteobacteria-11]
MQEPTIPEDEVARQRDLDQLNIVDTPADPQIDALLRLAQRLFQARTVLVTLLDGDRQWFKGRRGMSLAETPRKISFCAHAIQDEAIMEVPDARLDPRFRDNPLVQGEPYIRFYAGIPLHGPDGYRVGTFCVIDGSPRQLSDEQRQSMRDFARLIDGQFNIQQLRLSLQGLQRELKDARRRALLDPLTQLWNREGLQQMLPGYVRSAQREELLVGFIYADLDRFKAINDDLGHGVGDEVLIEVGQRLSAAIRPQDLAIRLGGEEFGVLALVSSHDQLAVIAERIRQAIRSDRVAIEEHRLQVTISLGTAVMHADDVDEGGELIDLADQALYCAKQAGRDCVMRG